jgi:hypothetical protein
VSLIDNLLYAVTDALMRAAAAALSRAHSTSIRMRALQGCSRQLGAAEDAPCAAARPHSGRPAARLTCAAGCTGAGTEQNPHAQQGIKLDMSGSCVGFLAHAFLHVWVGQSSADLSPGGLLRGTCTSDAEHI